MQEYCRTINGRRVLIRVYPDGRKSWVWSSGMAQVTPYIPLPDDLPIGQVQAKSEEPDAINPCGPVAQEDRARDS